MTIGSSTFSFCVCITDSFAEDVTDWFVLLSNIMFLPALFGVFGVELFILTVNGISSIGLCWPFGYLLEIRYSW